MHRGQNWYLLIATTGGVDHENYNYQWGGGEIGVLQSLLGGLGNFYCDIIKISPSPPPPLPPPLQPQVMNNDWCPRGST